MTTEKTGIIVENPESRREEETIIRDAEQVRAGEEAEAAARAADLADGVDLPISPDDVPESEAETEGPMDFDDAEDDPDDHGRGLV